MISLSTYASIAASYAELERKVMELQMVSGMDIDKILSLFLAGAKLEKQEATYPVCKKCGMRIGRISTSVFNYDGSDSDQLIPITYDKQSECVVFSTSQNWTGYELSDEERKERIRCPFCGEYPFDESVEIECNEPVEVMMWEGR